MESLGLSHYDRRDSQTLRITSHYIEIRKLVFSHHTNNKTLVTSVSVFFLFFKFLLESKACFLKSMGRPVLYVSISESLG